MQGLMTHPGWMVLKERLQQFAESEWGAAARPGQNAHDMSFHVGAAGAYRVAAGLPESIVRMATLQADAKAGRAAASQAPASP